MIFPGATFAIWGLVAAAAPFPDCRAAQLRLSIDADDGGSNDTSHSGVGLSIRNVGSDCELPGLPTIQLLDAHRRVLPAARNAPVGMHPGPVVPRLRLAGGHEVVASLRWVSAPVFTRSRRIAVAFVSIRIGAGAIEAALPVVLYGGRGALVTFDQTPLRGIEGMASG